MSKHKTGLQHDSITADQSNRQSEVSVLRVDGDGWHGKADLDESSGEFSEEDEEKLENIECFASGEKECSQADVK